MRNGYGWLCDKKNELIYEHCKISGHKNSDKFWNFTFWKKLFDGENKHGYSYYKLYACCTIQW